MSNTGTGTGVRPPVPASPAAPASRRAWGPPAVAALATLLCAGLTVANLGSRSLDYDEGYTVSLGHNAVSRSLWRIFNFEVNGSPYYLLFDVWHLLGEQEAVMRLLSVVFAVASVPLVYAAGRRLHGPWAGALAALVLATNGLLVSRAQTLRAYTLALFLVTLATWLLVRAVESPATRRAVAYGVVAALAVYAHFFAALVVGAHAASLLLLRPLPRRLMTVAGGVLAVLLAPLALFLATLNSDPLTWIQRSTATGLVQALGDVAGGGAEQLVVFAAIAGAGTWVAWRRWRRRPWSADAWRHALPVLSLTLPIAAVAAATFTVKPLLVSRFLTVVLPGLALLCGSVLARAGRRSAAAAAVAVAVVLVTGLLGVKEWHDTRSRENWRDGTALVLDRLQPGDRVVVVPPQGAHVVGYYQRRLGHPPLDLDVPDPGDPPTARRIWELRQNGALAPSSRPARELDRWLNANYPVARTFDFRGVTVRLRDRAP